MPKSSGKHLKHFRDEKSMRCLVEDLRNEKLFLENEKENIQTLFDSLNQVSKELASTGWLLGKQSSILEDLINGKQCISPDQCFKCFNAVEDTDFIDGYKAFTYQELKIGKFLHQLHKSPDLVALLLTTYPLTRTFSNCCHGDGVSMVMKELYGGFLIDGEENLAMQMIKSLIRLQTESSESLTSKLHHLQTSLFQPTLHLFIALSQECQAFITTVLHEPMAMVIHDDDNNYASNHPLFLAAVQRFITSITQHISLFPASFTSILHTLRIVLASNIKDKASVHRIDEFIMATMTDCLICRPLLSPQHHKDHLITPSMAHNLNLISKVIKVLCNHSLRVDERAAMTSVKYPSVGGDVQEDIADVLQHLDKNGLSCLVQVLNGWGMKEGDGEEKEEAEEEEEEEEEEDKKNEENILSKTSLIISPSSLVDLFRVVYDIAETQETAGEELLSIDTSLHHTLTLKLKRLLVQCNLPSFDFINTACSNHFRYHPSNCHNNNNKLAHKRNNKSVANNNNKNNNINNDNNSNKSISDSNFQAFTRSLDASPIIKKHLIPSPLSSSSSPSSSKLSPGLRTKSYYKRTYNKKSHDKFILSTNSTNLKINDEDEEEDDKKGGDDNDGSDDDGDDDDDDDVAKGCSCWRESSEVFVVSFGMFSECPGLKPEHKVLEEYRKQKELRNNDSNQHTYLVAENDSYNAANNSSNNTNNSNSHHTYNHNHSGINCNNNDNTSVPFLPVNPPIMEKVGKKTRFSLSNLPTGSNESEEAVSSHSTEEEEEEEEEEGEYHHHDSHENNSNLSDTAFSGNLSGRNTPSMTSGRDTPVSLTSNLDAVNYDGSNQDTSVYEHSSQGKKRGGVEVVVASKDVVVMEARGGRRKEVRRDDVTEKFGKFEIKQELESESKSTVSETWSTDVLASDSEPPENNAIERLQEVSSNQAINQPLNQSINQSVNHFYNQPPDQSSNQPSAINSLLTNPNSQRNLSFDALETASDAWSTDVMMGDKQEDRLLELDQDDSASTSSKVLQASRTDPFDAYPPIRAGACVITGVSANNNNICNINTTNNNIDNLNNIENNDAEFTCGSSNSTNFDFNFFSPQRQNTLQDQQQQQQFPQQQQQFPQQQQQFPQLQQQQFPQQQQATLPATSPPPPLPPRSSKAFSLNKLPANSPSTPLKPLTPAPDGELSKKNKNFNNNNNTSNNNNNNNSNNNNNNNSNNNNNNNFNNNINYNFNNNTNNSAINNKNNNKASLLLAPPLEPLKATTSAEKLGKSNDINNNDNLSLSLNNLDNDVGYDDYAGKGGDDDDSTKDKDSIVSSTSEKDEKKKKGKLFGHIRQKFNRTKSNSKNKNSILVDLDQEASVNYENDTSFGSFAPSFISPPIQPSINISSHSSLQPTISLPSHSSQPPSMPSATFHDDNIDNILNKYKRTVNLPAQLKPTQQTHNNNEQQKTTDNSNNNKNSTPNSDNKPCCSTDCNSENNKTSNNNRSSNNNKINNNTGDRFEEALLKLRIVLCKPLYASNHNRNRVHNVDANNNSVPLNYNKNSNNNNSNDNNSNNGNSNNNNSNSNNNKNDTQSNDTRARSVSFSGKDDSENITINHTSQTAATGDDTSDSSRHELLRLLREMQAVATAVGDHTSQLQISSLIDCLNSLPPHQLAMVTQRLHSDYEARRTYVVYLTRSKRLLLSCKASVQARKAAVVRERREVVGRMVGCMVQRFVAKQHMSLQQFSSQFNTIVLFDEKCDLLGRFLDTLHSLLTRDPEWTRHHHEAHTWLQRFVVAMVYKQAIFPNNEVDLSRDRLFLHHVQQLSSLVTPDHRAINIAMVYRSELPWTPAQHHLRMINAFKTPEDKLECVVRCCRCIMTLLSLSLATHGCSQSAPGADDFAPVLLYVVIKSCTPHLLSTIQYVESYCNNDRHCQSNLKRVFEDGEKVYWWTQLVWAVSFIKNMNYD